MEWITDMSNFQIDKFPKQEDILNGDNFIVVGLSNEVMQTKRMEFQDIWKKVQGVVDGLNETIEGLNTTIEGLQDKIDDLEDDISKKPDDISFDLNTIYPVGSIYISMSNGLPLALQALGNWEKCKGVTLWGLDNNEENSLGQILTPNIPEANITIGGNQSFGDHTHSYSYNTTDVQDYISNHPESSIFCQPGALVKSGTGALIQAIESGSRGTTSSDGGFTVNGSNFTASIQYPSKNTLSDKIPTNSDGFLRPTSIGVFIWKRTS